MRELYLHVSEESPKDLSVVNGEVYEHGLYMSLMRVFRSSALIPAWILVAGMVMRPY